MTWGELVKWMEEQGVHPTDVINFIDISYPHKDHLVLDVIVDGSDGERSIELS